MPLRITFYIHKYTYESNNHLTPIRAHHFLQEVGGRSSNRTTSLNSRYRHLLRESPSLIEPQATFLPYYLLWKRSKPQGSLLCYHTSQFWQKLSVSSLLV